MYFHLQAARCQGEHLQDHSPDYQGSHFVVLLRPQARRTWSSHPALDSRLELALLPASFVCSFCTGARVCSFKDRFFLEVGWAGFYATSVELVDPAIKALATHSLTDFSEYVVFCCSTHACLI
jgi:hypothetical protein